MSFFMSKLTTILLALLILGCTNKAKPEATPDSHSANSLKDTRDGKTYKIVKIGEQTWMAENLNYEAKGSTCYDNDPAKCEKYGRLYDWNTAMNACPKGWHLPSDGEWSVLMRSANPACAPKAHCPVAGKLLKATSGWNKDSNGTDIYGFAALPGGFALPPDGYYVGIGSIGSWWSTGMHKYLAHCAYHWEMRYENEYVSHTCEGDVLLRSVRCIQDHTESRDSTLVGGWVYVSGSSGDEKNKFSMNLLNDGIGELDFLRHIVFWETKNKRLMLLAPSINITADYEVSGYKLNLSYDNGDKALFVRGADLEKAIMETIKETIDNVKKDSFTDARNNKTYKTVKIGEQTWMAENLNYEAKGSRCYDEDRPALCQRYGRLYDWESALNACPEGWHLPSDAEWKTLVDLAGNEIAGKVLKAKSGWRDSVNGENVFGFSALPGGALPAGKIRDKYERSDFQILGRGGNWWSRTERDHINAYSRGMGGDAGVYRDIEGKPKSWFFSVRCVKGSALNLTIEPNLSQFFAGGNGTKANPYIISTKKHLENLSRIVKEGNDFKLRFVKLSANIMLNDTADWKNWEENPPVNIYSWTPIGGIGSKIASFRGTFDGNGHVVGGVYINSKGSGLGFFGHLDSGAVIENFGIVASYIKGDYYVGGFAGQNGDVIYSESGSYVVGKSGGNISESYFVGVVMGKDHVGGLVGANFGVISNSYSAGAVKGRESIGGLVGVNYNSVINSHFTGAISGKTYVGGIVGIGGIAGHDKATVINSYFNGTINGETK